MANWTLDSPSKRAWFLVMLFGIAIAFGSFGVYEIRHNYPDYWNAIWNRPYHYGRYRQSLYLGVLLAAGGFVMSFLQQWTWTPLASWIRNGSSQRSEVVSRPKPLPHTPHYVDGFNVREEAEKFFDPSSLASEGLPKIVILMGGVAAGKTTMRKQAHSSGFVLLDAVEIFLNLSRGGFYPFPEYFEKPMNMIGRTLALAAVMERRDIVTEIIGAEQAPTVRLIEAMKSIGYKVEVVAVHCDVHVAAMRNENRGNDAISAYYAESFQRSWLIEAASRCPRVDL